MNCMLIQTMQKYSKMYIQYTFSIWDRTETTLETTQMAYRTYHDNRKNLMERSKVSSTECSREERI